MPRVSGQLHSDCCACYLSLMTTQTRLARASQASCISEQEKPSDMRQSSTMMCVLVLIIQTSDIQTSDVQLVSE